jgi:hypothetical protein
LYGQEKDRGLKQICSVAGAGLLAMVREITRKTGSAAALSGFSRAGLLLRGKKFAGKKSP